MKLTFTVKQLRRLSDRWVKITQENARARYGEAQQKFVSDIAKIGTDTFIDFIEELYAKPKK